jgi:hypothetical protein
MTLESSPAYKGKDSLILCTVSFRYVFFVQTNCVVLFFCLFPLKRKKQKKSCSCYVSFSLMCLCIIARVISYFKKKSGWYSCFDRKETTHPPVSGPEARWRFTTGQISCLPSWGIGGCFS